MLVVDQPEASPGGTMHHLTDLDPIAEGLVESTIVAADDMPEVSPEDWDWYFETTFVDPAERGE